MPKRRIAGFTLTELVVTVAVVAILAAIALPSYNSQIRKSRRSDAIQSITNVHLAQEKWRSSQPTYSSSLTALGFASSPFTSTDGFYSVALSGASATGYVVTASAVSGKPQESDTACTSIVLTVAAGSIAQTPADCWNR
jgi:type IV pilus assembly protein PilE